MRQNILIGVWIVIVVVVASCQPSPEQLVELPTLAVFPTDTPTLPASPTRFNTNTPEPTFTPTNTPTAFPTLTPLPTTTPDLDAPIRACEDRIDKTMNLFIDKCAAIGDNQVCYGSSRVNATFQPSKPIDETWLNSGAMVSVEHLENLQTSHMDPERALWGTALVNLSGDYDATGVKLKNIDMVLFGSTELDNLVPSNFLQQEIRLATPVFDRAPFISPATRLTIRNGLPPTGCNFVPTGVLIQTISPSQLEINEVQFEIDGTIFLQVRPGEMMEVTSLEGQTRLTFPDGNFLVPLGTKAITPVDSRGIPQKMPENLVAYDRVLQTGLFDATSAVFDLLDHPIDPPPVPSSEELTQLNTFSGDWLVSTSVIQIDGLLTEGQAVTRREIDDALDLCEWQGAWLLGQPSEFTYRIEMDSSKQAIGIEAYYPDVLFPPQLLRVSELEPIYEGEVYGVGNLFFEHRLEFTSPIDFKWRVEASGLSNGICSRGVIEGVGKRLPQREVESGASNSTVNSWQVSILPGDFYVPETRNLSDCKDDSLITGIPPQSLFSTIGENRIQIQSSLPGIRFPQALDPDLLINSSYVGTAIDGDQEYIHRIKFADNTLIWRVMVRSISQNCRLAALEGTGNRIVGRAE